MAELSVFKWSDAHDLLAWAFSVLAENAGSPGYAGLSGGVYCRLSKVLGMKEAAHVVSFVDCKLDPIQRDLIRFCYARGRESDEARQYNVLHNYAWDQVSPSLAKRRQKVRDGLSFIRFMVPYEVRSRILMQGRRQCDNAMLSGYLQIDRKSFSESYRDSWEAMVDSLMAMKGEAFVGVEAWLDSILSARLDADHDRKVVDEIARLMRAG